MDPVDYNFTHSINLFGSTTTVGQALEARDFVASNSTAPVAEFNQSALKGTAHKLPRTLDRLEDYYRRAKVPYRVHVLGDDAAATAELLARGYVRATDIPCMVFEGPRCEAPPVAGLEVRTVRDPEALADFQKLAFASFGYPLEIAPHALTAELMALPHVALFVGYLDGQRAACSALIQTGNVTGIYWVGTLDTFRARGLGAAITAHAVNAGLARGAQRVCLQASAMGAPVYRRLGFSTPRTYQRFDHAALEATTVSV